MGKIDVSALSGVSLYIKQGEMISIVGPSGSGKSTLLNCIFRSEIPSEGKIMIDTTVPLQKIVTKVQLPTIGSSAMEAQKILGNEVEVVSALQNIGSHLVSSEDTIKAEVLVTGNNKGSVETVMSLVSCLGLKCWHAGDLENSAAAEALTSVLIVINKNHKLKSSGIKITSH